MGKYIKVSYNRKCAYCGKEFVAHDKRKEYCSHRCKDTALKIKKGIKVNPNVEPYHKICIVCGKSFDTFREASVTCSHECAEKHRKWVKNEPTEKVCEICGTKFLSAYPNARTCGDKTCKETHKKLAHKIRNRNAREKKKLLIKIETRTCVVCQKSFDIDSRLNNKTCSKKCSIEHTRQMKHKRHDKRIPRDRRIDNITLKKLYRRDSGTCYLCGGVCNWNDWQTSANGNKYPGDTYPTIEHIVAISRGGLDAWDNVRLAHWKCNIKKSDNVIKIEPMSMAFAYSEKRKGNQPKKTAQYTIDGELIRVWNSTAEIRRTLGLNDKHIQNVCRDSKTGNAYGYHWEYLEENNDKCG